MRTNIKLAQTRALLRNKFHGSPLTIQWTEWTSEPVVDVTTGSTISTPGTQHTVNTKAMIHSIKPTMGVRLFTEVQVGDVIIDLLAPLKRITAVGQAQGFIVGQVVDLFTLRRANRLLSESDKATAEDVDATTLKNASVIIDGEVWEQRDVGSELVKMWDATFAGIKVSQSLLLRKSA